MKSSAPPGFRKSPSPWPARKPKPPHETAFPTPAPADPFGDHSAHRHHVLSPGLLHDGQPADAESAPAQSQSAHRLVGDSYHQARYGDAHGGSKGRGGGV